MQRVENAAGIGPRSKTCRVQPRDEEELAAVISCTHELVCFRKALSYTRTRAAVSISGAGAYDPVRECSGGNGAAPFTYSHVSVWYRNRGVLKVPKKVPPREFLSLTPCSLKLDGEDLYESHRVAPSFGLLPHFFTESITCPSAFFLSVFQCLPLHALHSHLMQSFSKVR